MTLITRRNQRLLKCVRLDNRLTGPGDGGIFTFSLIKYGLDSTSKGLEDSHPNK